MRDEATVTMKPYPTMMAVVVTNYGYKAEVAIHATVRMYSIVY